MNVKSFLADVSEAEQQFLSGKRDRGDDLESAVRICLEFLRGFEFFGEIDRSCVTVFGSARALRCNPQVAPPLSSESGSKADTAA